MGCGASSKSKYEALAEDVGKLVPTVQADSEVDKKKAAAHDTTAEKPAESTIVTKGAESTSSDKFKGVSFGKASPKLPTPTTSISLAPMASNEVETNEVGTKEVSDDDDDDWVDEIPESHRASESQSQRRRCALSADAHGDYNKRVDFVLERIPKTQEQADLIRMALLRSPWMASMTSRDEDLEIAIAAFKHVELPKGAEVIRQGEDGDELYLLESGVVDFYIKGKDEAHPGKQVKQMSEPGNEFGELALLHNAPRKATVVVKEDCSLWSLSRNAFNSVMHDNEAKRYDRHLGFLRSVKLLEKLDIIDIGKVAENVKQHIISNGEYVVREGAMADRFYMVEEGEAMAITHGMEVRSYKRGGYFGELSLINDRPTPADIVAKSDKLRLVSLDRASFKRLLGKDALFKDTKTTSERRPESRDGTGSEGTKKTKKRSIRFSIDENEDRPKLKRKGTGFVQKNKIKELLSQMQDIDVEDEPDSPDSPDSSRNVRFKGDDDDVDPKDCDRKKKIRTTGFIHADQLRSILLEAGEDVPPSRRSSEERLSEGSRRSSGDEDKTTAEQSKKTAVKFEACPGEGMPKKLVKRGTGFIHVDQLKKILAEAEMDEDEDEEAENSSTVKPGRVVQFDADPSQGRPKLHKKGTGFIFKEQLQNLLAGEEGEDEAEEEHQEEVEDEKENDDAEDNDLDAHDVDVVTPTGKSRQLRRVSDAVIYVSPAQLRKSLGDAYDIPEVEATISEAEEEED